MPLEDRPAGPAFQCGAGMHQPGGGQATSLQCLAGRFAFLQRQIEVNGAFQGGLEISRDLPREACMGVHGFSQFTQEAKEIRLVRPGYLCDPQLFYERSHRPV